MCCIFTCCGWLIDLVQRLWTFTMSCFISSAVCCSFLTASMSGVALGYNYSLAEYIDLKETNVSIYLKRGVFDDDIADDMEWRRSGHLPISGHIKEDNLMTGASDDSATLRSGRRLDDSIYESNDRNHYEGSLMRLTAKAPDPTPASTTTRPKTPMSDLIEPFQPGSVEQLKAIQSAINMMKAADLSRRITTKSQETTSDSNRRYVGPDDANNRRFGNFVPEGRRAMKYDVPALQRPSTINSYRLAVPDDQINDPAKWLLPKLPPQSVPKQMLYYDEGYPTLPSPVTPRAGPARPTKPSIISRLRTSTARSSLTPSRSPEPNLPKSIDEEMESFKEKPLIDRFDSPSIKDDDFLKKIKVDSKKPDEDYEDEIKGVPLRKKRNISFPTLNRNVQTQESNKVNNRHISDNNIRSYNDNIILKSVKLGGFQDNSKNNNLGTNVETRKNHESAISKTLKNLGITSESPIIKLLLAASVT